MLSRRKKYLITGGSGFLGQVLIKRLIKNGYKNLRVVSRNEGQLVKLKELYPEVEIVIGDIASNFVCQKATKGVDGIFHLAAMKHIGLAEKNTMECIHSNILGTFNILKYSAGCDFIIGISTDKAAQVNGVYGATKLLMERLFSEFEGFQSGTSFRIVRYGNVLYSTGSVLCKWKDKIINNEEIIITDKKATRFYWTVDQAIDLIFRCLDEATDATPYCPEMKSMKLGDLLKAMIEKYNPNYNGNIKVIGLQQGENMHEKLTADGKDSSQVEKYSKKEIKELI